MDECQNGSALNYADTDLTIFAIVCPINRCRYHHTFENAFCKLKADAMFGDIAGVFLVVPLKHGY